MRSLGRHLVAAAITALLALAIATAMVRFGPGYGLEEAQMDPRLSDETVARMRAEARAGGFWTQYWRFARGDWGVSTTLNTPVADLLRGRAGVTAKLVACGVFGGWCIGLLAAAAVTSMRARWPGAAAGFFAHLTLCIPAAVLALLTLHAGGPVYALPALIVAPKIFQHARHLLADAWLRPHVDMARARGVAPHRLLLWHVAPTAAPQLLALAGVSFLMALGAAVPIEAICDLPGIGHLMWKAALGRDLPVLAALTMIVTVLAQATNRIAGGAL